MEEKGSKCSQYPEELREIGVAALGLSSLKNAKLNTKNSIILEKQKRSYLGKNYQAQKPHQELKNVALQEDLVDGEHQRISPPKKRQRTTHGNRRQRRQHDHDHGQETHALLDHPMAENIQGIVGECSRSVKKELFPSDIRDKLQRLNLPKKESDECFNTFLTLEERTMIQDDAKIGLKVTVFDTDGKGYKMSYKYWVKDKGPVLTCGWKDFSAHHGLVKNDMLTLWMFRHACTKELCMFCIAEKPAI